MRILLALGLLATANFCHALSFKPIPQSEFIQVTKGSFDRFVVKDKKILAKYDRIVFSKLMFDEFTITPSKNKEINETWVLTEEDKKEYSEYFKDELLGIYDGESVQQPFGLANGKSASTLLAKTQLLTLRPIVAKNGLDEHKTIGSQSVESLGSLTVRITLVDSMTNEFVAVLEDGQDLAAGSSGLGANNRSNNAHIWKKAFHVLLADLKDTLTELKAKE